MPTPTMAARHYDLPLSNISIAYMQQAENFIAHKVFPVVPVKDKSGFYYKWDRGEWLKAQARKRADITESAGSGFTLSQDDYLAHVYAFHQDVGEQTEAMAGPAFAPLSEAARFVAQIMMNTQEVDFANSFFKTGVWGNDLVGHASTNTGSNFIKFDNYSTSTPIATIDRAKDLVEGVTGLEVNTMVMGKDVFNVLKEHPAIIDRIKYTTADVVTEQLLAKYFGVQRVFIGKALTNTAKEGAADAISRIYKDGILLTHSAPRPGLMTASAGYTFEWTGYAGLGAGTYQIPQPNTKATRVETEAAWANKVVAPDLGVFLSDVIG